MSQLFRVVTNEYHHFFRKGDIVELTGAPRHEGRDEYRCIEGPRESLEQVLRPDDVEAIE